LRLLVLIPLNGVIEKAAKFGRISPLNFGDHARRKKRESKLKKSSKISGNF
jgi:hypothetical protein